MRFRLVSAKDGFCKAGLETVTQGWVYIELLLGQLGAECEGVIGWWLWLSVDVPGSGENLED